MKKQVPKEKEEDVAKVLQRYFYPIKGANKKPDGHSNFFRASETPRPLATLVLKVMCREYVVPKYQYELGCFQTLWATWLPVTK